MVNKAARNTITIKPDVSAANLNLKLKYKFDVIINIVPYVK